MSEPKLISPMLDNFAMGDPISEHNGVSCCPAMETGSEQKYIVKIISTPASQTQLEALLLSGAYADNDAALQYFQSVTDSIEEEVQVLKKLSQHEGFLPFEKSQAVPMDDGVGFDISAGYDETKHVGIKNIRGRIEAMCGGTLTIESEIGKGTKATITIPKEG